MSDQGADDATDPGADESAVCQEGGHDGEGERDDAHLRDVEVGAGCTEIWEHLAEYRREE